MGSCAIEQILLRLVSKIYIEITTSAIAQLSLLFLLHSHSHTSNKIEQKNARCYSQGHSNICTHPEQKRGKTISAHAEEAKQWINQSLDVGWIVRLEFSSSSSRRRGWVSECSSFTACAWRRRWHPKNLWIGSDILSSSSSSQVIASKSKQQAEQDQRQGYHHHHTHLYLIWWSEIAAKEVYIRIRE